MSKSKKKPAASAGGDDRRTVSYRVAPAIDEAADAYNASLSPGHRIGMQTLLDRAVRAYLTGLGFRPADEPEPRS